MQLSVLAHLSTFLSCPPTGYQAHRPPGHELSLYLAGGILRPRCEGEKVETTQWQVTLTFRVTVSGAHSKDRSVAVGLEQLKLGLCSGEEVPMEANVRRITNLVEEEPIFGVKW